MKQLLIFICITLSALFYYTYGSKSEAFRADAFGYYSYLPSVVIYNNLRAQYTTPKDRGIEQKYMAELDNTYNLRTPLGYTLNQYTYAVALMEAPFFLVAHAYELARGSQANGYSESYHLMIKISSMVYALLGLIVLYRVLKRFFSDIHALLATLIVYIGTNLFWFTILQAGMAHVPLFLLYGLLILLTIKIHERPKTSLFAAAGFVIGLITVMRPTDVLCILIPLLYNVYDRDTLQQKILLIKGNIWNILLLAVVFIIPVLPQLMYWKAVTGHFIYYSYGDQSFDWRHPKIIEGLFLFKNGWLMYSPVMIIAVAGIVRYHRIKPWAWCIWLILPLYIYIIYSWWCYNYINGLGSRPMIHIYPLLAIPLAAVIHLVSKYGVVVKSLFALVVVFLVAVNLSYSLQKTKGIINTAWSNKQFNKQTFFHTELRYYDLVTAELGIAQPDTSKLTKIAVLTSRDNEDSTSDHYERDTVYGSKYVYHMAADEPYHQPENIMYNHEQFKDAKWVKLSGKFMYTPVPPGRLPVHILMFAYPNQTGVGCEIINKVAPWTGETIPGMYLDYYQPYQWGYVHFFMPVPDGLKDGDILKVFVWNVSNTPLLVDDMSMELYK